MKRRFALSLSLIALGLAGCHYERPIHPYRLEGWPGAPIEGDLFPLRTGRYWAFRDRMAEDGPELRLELAEEDGRWVLRGRTSGAVELRLTPDYLEIWQGGRLVERPLPRKGRVAYTWKAVSGRAFVFGYDRIEVLGEERRALVVAIDRHETRDLIWFVDGMGWVRFRTERSGSPVRDAILVEYRPGSPN